MVRIFTMITAMVLIGLMPITPASARPVRTIDCPLQAMSAKDQTRIALTLINDGSPGIYAARAFILPLAEDICGKPNKWSVDRSQGALTWTMWSIMSDELQKETGLSLADAAILRAYFDQHPKELEGMAEFSAAQRSQLIGELRKLGAHLHDDGSKLSEQELTIIMLAQQMRKEEAQFGAP